MVLVGVVGLYPKGVRWGEGREEREGGGEAVGREEVHVELTSSAPALTGHLKCMTRSEEGEF